MLFWRFASLLCPIVASAQRFEINVGSGIDPGIFGLMREVDQAQKAGDEARYQELKKKLDNFRSAKVDFSWTSECRVSAYFDAEIFTVPGPSSVPKEIEWAFPKLDEYWRTDDGGDLPYPGDFNQFMHKDGFRVIMVQYDQLPQAVREWREKKLKEGDSNERKWIAVVDGMAFFAPGVVTWLQPLFASRDVVLGKNACEDQLTDFQNFRGGHKRTEDVKFITGFSGLAEIGTTLRVQAFAERQVKQSHDDEKGKNRNNEL
ncbi:unnamed protein product [Clonostachys chloroleuca]|uniref:Uncharacterized protein n=1 Tax=Clonostachys chloroleuca TaxID=1926264 RepID=A0AA35QFS3_9HYPO|nr:unnamed protein product [Clonostachys chloroleuca]